MLQYRAPETLGNKKSSWGRGTHTSLGRGNGRDFMSGRRAGRCLPLLDIRIVAEHARKWQSFSFLQVKLEEHSMKSYFCQSRRPVSEWGSHNEREDKREGRNQEFIVISKLQVNPLSFDKPVCKLSWRICAVWTQSTWKIMYTCLN